MTDPQPTPSVSPTTNLAPRSLAAERMRRHRRRKRNSMRCLTIELRKRKSRRLFAKDYCQQKCVTIHRLLGEHYIGFLTAHALRKLTGCGRGLAGRAR